MRSLPFRVLAAALLALPAAAAQAQLTESFDAGVPAGWTFDRGAGVRGGSAFATGSAGFFSSIFTVGLNGRITFDARFDGGDELPYNDFGRVRLYDVTSASFGPDLFFRDIAAVGDGGSSGWVTVSAPVAAGTYQIQGLVQNAIDQGYASTLRLDNVDVTSLPVTATPEPGTWALMLTGLAGVAGAARRRRRAA